MIRLSGKYLNVGINKARLVWKSRYFYLTMQCACNPEKGSDRPQRHHGSAGALLRCMRSNASGTWHDMLQGCAAQRAHLLQRGNTYRELLVF